MPTRRSIVSTCCARAALAGNPSDGYGGAVVAVPVSDLTAAASTEPADRFSIRTNDPELRGLLRATADAYEAHVGSTGPVTLSATTTIPRSVGLAGSSAIIVAALRALGAVTRPRWEPVDLAQLALSVERDRMGITAGLQDRIVQAVGQAVSMTFEPVGYRTLDRAYDFPLFVAWSATASAASDTVHRSLRRRFDAGDAHVCASMGGLATQARLAAAAIDGGDHRGLAAAISRTFEIRTMMIDVDDTTMALAEVGARAGAAVNSAGSGGSVVGLAADADHLVDLAEAYESKGFDFLEV